METATKIKPSVKVDDNRGSEKNELSFFFFDSEKRELIELVLALLLFVLYQVRFNF